MLSAKEIYELNESNDIEKVQVNQNSDDKILVQGIIDLYYINKNDELIFLTIRQILLIMKMN